MKDRTASGIDNIPMELWKYGGFADHVRIEQRLMIFGLKRSR